MTPAIALLSACSGGNDGHTGIGEAQPFEGYSSSVYTGGEKWLCHPSLADDENVCSSNLDTTRVYADGSTEMETFTPALDPQVDCFYVYPTYSTDTGDNSDLQEGPGEIYATVSQAARYSQFCRVFAPVYRQTTISALFANGEPDFAVAYVDVLDSFKQYIANDNKGRGFVLVGLIFKRANGPFADPANGSTITTPFYSMPGLITGDCVVDDNGVSYLEATVHADATDPRADDFNGEFMFGVGFGLHLVDMTLALGDLVELGAAESRAWLQDQ
jgi:hypothetical protein